ncbi:MAG: mechanosensitive ion channel family protein [Clostridia bacterium]|nr:mechanosensitive ion channel family protein [Clostridia bacterium]
MNVEEFLTNLVGKAADLGLKLLAALLVLIIGRILIKWAVKLISKSKFAKNTDATVVRVLLNFISAGLYVLLAVTIIAILGVPMASVVALVASAGVAIGLALQGALSNLAGGIMIMILRPFHIGDFVEIAGNSGTVKDVGIFYTVINTGDNKVITIPNGTVMANAITNYSKNNTRRVDLVFNVAYGTDVAKVNAILLEEAGKHELALKDPAPFARMTKQSESSLDFTLRVWVNAGDYWTVNFDLLENINNRFAKEGIEIPFNQLDVHIKDQK